MGRIGTLKSVFERLFRGQGRKKNEPANASLSSASSLEPIDVQDVGFPLVPDRYHLQHVGRTAQGNGYWIDLQLASEDGDTRDFVAAYVFDKAGYLISCDVVDKGKRNQSPPHSTEKIIERLKRKIDAKETAEIWVRPFSVTYYGHIFGLIVREYEEGDADTGETLVDAMPGWTLMFHGPWSSCNYSS